MRDSRIYRIRQEILKGLMDIYPAPCDFDDLASLRQLPFLKPTRDELSKEWHALLAKGYITALEGSDGEYVVISAAGQDQINGETDKDKFIWGKFGLKAFIAIFAISLLFICTGCRSTSTIYEYQEGMLVKKTETSESVVKQIIDSTKNKTIYIWSKGWIATLTASMMTAEDPIPVVKIYAGHVDQGILTVPKDQKTDGLADIIRACNSASLEATAEGITGAMGSAATDTSTLRLPGAKSLNPETIE